MHIHICPHCGEEWHCEFEICGAEEEMCAECIDALTQDETATGC